MRRSASCVVDKRDAERPVCIPTETGGTRLTAIERDLPFAHKLHFWHQLYTTVRIDRRLYVFD